MSAAPLVATLIAQRGTCLSDAHLDLFVQRVTRSGGKIDQTTIHKNQEAADVIYIGPPVAAGDLPFDVLTQLAATRRKKILIADMESTIIEQEMLDELATEIGIGDEVSEITRRAMNGELDFAAALALRASLLQGQPESLLDTVAARITLMPGAQRLIEVSKRAGTHCWLVSGGFTFFVKKIADQLGFDRYFANELILKNGHITGHVGVPILDKNSKKTLLETACAEYGLNFSEAVAVGDGANDIPMLQTCGDGGGLGVAFYAKPSVRAVIANQINHSDLTALLYAQGLFF